MTDKNCPVRGNSEVVGTKISLKLPEQSASSFKIRTLSWQHRTVTVSAIIREDSVNQRENAASLQYKNTLSPLTFCSSLWK